MQAHIKILLFSKNCTFYPVTFFNQTSPKFPLLLPSHNCIIIHNVQFSRYKFEFLKKLNEASIACCFSQFLWWRLAGSNRWPPACKAGALPAELNPQISSLVLKWWAKMDSNHRPHDYQSCALASWAIGPYWFLHFFCRYTLLCTL